MASPRNALSCSGVEGGPTSRSVTALTSATASRTPPLPRTERGVLCWRPVLGAPARASCPCPPTEERHGEGWQGSHGCRRRLLREVQGEAEDIERAAGEDGE